jgi:UDP-glucuronate 4-epimerase
VLRPAGYEIVNLGSDRPVTVRQIIALLEKRLRQSARVEHLPPHPADVPATWADVTKARRLLGWSAEMPLEEGLHEAVAWYQQNRPWASTIDLGE